MGFSAWEKGDANIGLVWLKKKCSPWEFPGSPVVSDFAAEGMGSILQAVWHSEKPGKEKKPGSPDLELGFPLAQW